MKEGGIAGGEGVGMENMNQCKKYEVKRYEVNGVRECQGRGGGTEARKRSYAVIRSQCVKPSHA